MSIHHFRPVKFWVCTIKCTSFSEMTFFHHHVRVLVFDNWWLFITFAAATALTFRHSLFSCIVWDTHIKIMWNCGRNSSTYFLMSCRGKLESCVQSQYLVARDCACWTSVNWNCRLLIESDSHSCCKSGNISGFLNMKVTVSKNLWYFTDRFVYVHDIKELGS